MKSTIPRFVTAHRFPILLAAHLLVFLFAYLAAILLRFDFAVPIGEWAAWSQLLPFVLLVKAGVFYYMGAFYGWWRYVTFADLADLLKASAVSTLLLLAIDYLVIAEYQVPRGIVVLDFGNTILILGGLRASFRLLREHFFPMGGSTKGRPALIVGANRTGEAIARLTRSNGQMDYRAVGFLDDDEMNHGSRLGGLPVLGRPDDVQRLAQRMNAKAVLVPADSLSGRRVRVLAEKCRQADILVKVVPPIEDLVSGRYRFQIRDVDINDLLRRDPVQLDTASIERTLDGRRVMITGAGGSIGSEICRQVARFRPASIILVERFESALFFIDRELREAHQRLLCHPCVADIRDRRRMKALFRRHEPDILFHAAAHKHVPMMELNPCEAVKNNVFGTQCIADLSLAFGVQRFVLISTDKAVHPTSVMGVSKQLAERYIHALPNGGSTKFVTVRFGNVLGSIGSVVPVFQEQIRRGGPVTVTHPDMCRYFMTIPEASQLVLQAAAIGRGGEVFVLEMGEPVKIVDLARDLIRLSGLSTDEIPIEFTGIRPGEKLFEELRFDDEEVLPTSHPKISVVYHRPYDFDAAQLIADLRSVIDSEEALLEKFAALVPDYRADGSLDKITPSEPAPLAAAAPTQVTD